MKTVGPWRVFSSLAGLNHLDLEMKSVMSNEENDEMIPANGSQVRNEDVEAISGLLKTMAHPIRLKILCLLQDNEMTVGDIQSEVKTSNANVSQHLSILRNHGIIVYRKDANFIYNRINDYRILKLIQTMHELFCPEHTI